MYINTDRNLEYNINNNDKIKKINEETEEFICATECPDIIREYIRKLLRRDLPKKISSRKYLRTSNLNYCRTCGQNISLLFDARGTKARYCPYCGQAFSSYYNEIKKRKKQQI